MTNLSVALVTIVIVGVSTMIPTAYEAFARSQARGGMFEGTRQSRDHGWKAEPFGSGGMGCNRPCGHDVAWGTGNPDAADPRSPASRRISTASREVAANETRPSGVPTEDGKDYLLVFSGFSTEEKRGIEEYLVEFPGYLKHRLMRDQPEERQYRYLTEANETRLNSSLTKMLSYLDVTGKVSIAGDTVRVANLAARPETPPKTDGPIALRLSSARGRQPTYQIGEKLDLLIELDRDGWLYCFYRQHDGRVFKFFPNIYHKVAWLAGGRTHRVPGEIYPFDLNITEPPGKESLVCFATDRNVTSDLPGDLRELDMSPLPTETAERLAEIFRGLPDAAVTETDIVITVSR